MGEKFGPDVFKLGFGLMRLPRLGDGSIDVETLSEMVDLFLAAGGTYFDTAYVYTGSEEATRKALVERYPRDAYTLCTKLVAWAQCHDEESAKAEFTTSLERTGAGYFDYYLLHAIQQDNYKKYDDYHIWDYVRDLKERGLVKRWGFSFHAGPELLDQLLTEHPDVDFVQLQLNYADWENPGIQSRANYEVARKHGKLITVMEPVKGGMLADPPEKVKDLFQQADPAASAASWAIRYVASLPGILTVLSGMTTVEQMRDNLSYMKDFRPLDEGEQAMIRRAQELMMGGKFVPCTDCRYCMPGCPQEIPIPEVFKSVNRYYQLDQLEGARKDYARRLQDRSKASDCIACGQCESVCPQHLSIISLLEESARLME